jgi:AraC-like DNA-binding protein
MTHEYTIQARSVSKIIDFAAEYGVESVSLYDSVAFDPGVLQNPDHRIPFAQLVALYESAAQLTGDQCFGIHLAERIDPRVFDVLGYVVINSPTIGEALTRIARFHSIWQNGAVLELEVLTERAKITYRYLDRSISECRQDHEMTMATVISLGRLVTDYEWKALAVHFSHPAPADYSEYTRIFKAPVKFNQDSCQLIFDTSSLDLKINKADPGLSLLLNQHAEHLLAAHPPAESIVDSVRRSIKDELKGGDASLERIAAKLGLSSRTLQRRLREQNSSHNELLDEVRKQHAVRFLGEQHMAVCEVAYLLGFSESSAFHRAFKRWTGKTPGEFREMG